MKRFSFKLEPLLNYRRYLERLAQQETAKAHMDVKACESLIKRLETELKHQSDQMDSNLETGMTSSEFRRFHDYFQGTGMVINDEQKRRQMLKNRLDKKI